MSTLPVPHPNDTVDLKEHSRNRNENTKIRDGSASMKDVEMIDTTSTRGQREGTREGTNFPLPGIPSPPLSPSGMISDNKPDSFYMLKKEKEQTILDYNNDCPNKNNSTDAATIANHMHMNNENSGDNDDECIDDNVSPSDKQFRLFNIKI